MVIATSVSSRLWSAMPGALQFLVLSVIAAPTRSALVAIKPLYAFRMI
jgi:hypothetical protein